MDERNIQGIIDYSVKKYFDEKEARELKTKQEAEEKERIERYKKNREENRKLIGEIVAISSMLINCYMFLKFIGVV